MDSSFGPAIEAYDPEWVASSAMQADPSLDQVLATALAQESWALLREIGSPDTNELARRLMASHPEHGATAANVVACAAVGFFTQYDE